jgi:hypothetical protein
MSKKRVKNIENYGKEIVNQLDHWLEENKENIDPQLYNNEEALYQLFMKNINQVSITNDEYN